MNQLNNTKDKNLLKEARTQLPNLANMPDGYFPGLSSMLELQGDAQSNINYTKIYTKQCQDRIIKFLISVNKSSHFKEHLQLKQIVLLSQSPGIMICRIHGEFNKNEYTFRFNFYNRDVVDKFFDSIENTFKESPEKYSSAKSIARLIKRTNKNIWSPYKEEYKNRKKAEKVFEVLITKDINEIKDFPLNLNEFNKIKNFMKNVDSENYNNEFDIINNNLFTEFLKKIKNFSDKYNKKEIEISGGKKIVVKNNKFISNLINESNKIIYEKLYSAINKFRSANKNVIGKIEEFYENHFKQRNLDSNLKKGIEEYISFIKKDIKKDGLYSAFNSGELSYYKVSVDLFHKYTSIYNFLYKTNILFFRFCDDGNDDSFYKEYYEDYNKTKVPKDLNLSYIEQSYIYGGKNLLINKNFGRNKYFKGLMILKYRKNKYKLKKAVKLTKDEKISIFIQNHFENQNSIIKNYNNDRLKNKKLKSLDYKEKKVLLKSSILKRDLKDFYSNLISVYGKIINDLSVNQTEANKKLLDIIPTDLKQKYKNNNELVIKKIKELIDEINIKSDKLSNSSKNLSEKDIISYNKIVKNYNNSSKNNFRFYARGADKKTQELLDKYFKDLFYKNILNENKAIDDLIREIHVLNLSKSKIEKSKVNIEKLKLQLKLRQKTIKSILLYLKKYLLPKTINNIRKDLKQIIFDTIRSNDKFLKIYQENKKVININKLYIKSLKDDVFKNFKYFKELDRINKGNYKLSFSEIKSEINNFLENNKIIKNFLKVNEIDSNDNLNILLRNNGFAESLADTISLKIKPFIEKGIKNLETKFNLKDNDEKLDEINSEIDNFDDKSKELEKIKEEINEKKLELEKLKLEYKKNKTFTDKTLQKNFVNIYGKIKKTIGMIYLGDKSENISDQDFNSLRIEVKKLLKQEKEEKTDIYYGSEENKQYKEELKEIEKKSKEDRKEIEDLKKLLDKKDKTMQDIANKLGFEAEEEEDEDEGEVEGEEEEEVEAEEEESEEGAVEIDLDKSIKEGIEYYFSINKIKNKDDNFVIVFLDNKNKIKLQINNSNFRDYTFKSERNFKDLVEYFIKEKDNKESNVEKHLTYIKNKIFNNRKNQNKTVEDNDIIKSTEEFDLNGFKIRFTAPGSSSSSK